MQQRPDGVCVFLVELTANCAKFPQDTTLIAPASAVYPTLMPPSKRVALVVGISAYQHLSPLAHCVPSACAAAELLLSSGYVVTLVLDGALSSVRDGLSQFTASLRDGYTAVVYFCGYGLPCPSADGVDGWLAPADCSGAYLRCMPVSPPTSSIAKSPVPVALLFALLFFHIQGLAMALAAAFQQERSLVKLQGVHLPALWLCLWTYGSGRPCKPRLQAGWRRGACPGQAAVLYHHGDDDVAMMW